MAASIRHRALPGLTMADPACPVAQGRMAYPLEPRATSPVPAPRATGGEDYELLISAPESVMDALARETEVSITVVGEVTDGGVLFERGGEPVEGVSGWDHFA